MKQVFRIDQNGYLVEPVALQENAPIPSDCVNIFPPYGLYQHKWNGASWEEGLSQEEIDTIQNRPVPLSEIELLKKQQTDLVFELMMKGVL